MVIGLKTFDGGCRGFLKEMRFQVRNMLDRVIVSIFLKAWGVFSVTQIYSRMRDWLACVAHRTQFRVSVKIVYSI
jgi:hypothetical protein